MTTVRVRDTLRRSVRTYKYAIEKMTDLDKKPKTINAELIYYMFDEIKGELREMKKDYVTKSESQALKQEIHQLRQEIDLLKQQKNFWSWFSPTLTAVFTALFTYLVIEYLKK